MIGDTGKHSGGFMMFGSKQILCEALLGMSRHQAVHRKKATKHSREDRVPG